MLAEDAIWDQIDHTLVSLKLQQARTRLDRETEAKSRQVYARNRGNLNAASIPAGLLDVEIEQMKTWADTVYRIYCETWEAQGHQKTPAFVREVYIRAVVPALESRESCAANSFTRRARTSGQDAVLGGLLTELHLAALG